MKQIHDDIKDIKYSQTRFEENQARLEKKIDSVVNQTVDLTEFRTETKDQLQKIHSDLTAVEIVTSKNWNDVAMLKIVK